MSYLIYAWHWTRLGGVHFFLSIVIYEEKHDKVEFVFRALHRRGNAAIVPTKTRHLNECNVQDRERERTSASTARSFGQFVDRRWHDFHVAETRSKVSFVGRIVLLDEFDTKTIDWTYDEKAECAVCKRENRSHLTESGSEACAE